jgi:small conductance mechanosensitive channel
MDEITKIAQNPAAIEQHFSRAMETVMAVVTTYGLKVVGAVIILIVGWITAGVIQKAIQRAGARTHRIDPTVITFASSAAKYVAIVVTLIAMLGSFGVQTASFVAVLGAAGLAIGLALQGTLSHVASGLLLIFFRPFRVGDYIEAGGVAGHVQSITLFVTELDTIDNIHIVVPNSLIWSRDMKNFHANKNRRLELKFQISHTDDAGQALKIIEDLVANDKRALKSPEPLIGVHGFTDSGVGITAFVWVPREDFQPVQFDLNRAVKVAFDREGFARSFPQRLAPPPAPTTPQSPAR